MISSAFLLTSLIVVLIPGTGALYTVSNGLMGSRKNAIMAAIGCTLGIVPHLLASMLGLSAIMHMGATIFQIIKYIGVIYLLFLAWNMWNDKEGLSVEENSEKNSKFKIIGRAILINLLNPKLTIFFFSFLPQFIDQKNGSITLQMAILSAIFMIITLIVFMIYGIFANMFKRFLVNSPKIKRGMSQTFAMMFAGMAIKLASSE